MKQVSHGNHRKHRKSCGGKGLAGQAALNEEGADDGSEYGDDELKDGRPGLEVFEIHKLWSFEIMWFGGYEVVMSEGVREPILQAAYRTVKLEGVTWPTDRVIQAAGRKCPRFSPGSTGHLTHDKRSRYRHRYGCGSGSALAMS